MSRAHPPAPSERVTCESCSRFLPWPGNPTAAMGRCGVGRDPRPPEPALWPSVRRICPKHDPKETAR